MAKKYTSVKRVLILREAYKMTLITYVKVRATRLHKTVLVYYGVFIFKRPDIIH